MSKLTYRGCITFKAYPASSNEVCAKAVSGRFCKSWKGGASAALRGPLCPLPLLPFQLGFLVNIAYSHSVTVLVFLVSWIEVSSQHKFTDQLIQIGAFLILIRHIHLYNISLVYVMEYVNNPVLCNGTFSRLDSIRTDTITQINY